MPRVVRRIAGAALSAFTIGLVPTPGMAAVPSPCALVSKATVGTALGVSVEPGRERELIGGQSGTTAGCGFPTSTRYGEVTIIVERPGKASYREQLQRATTAAAAGTRPESIPNLGDRAFSEYGRVEFLQGKTRVSISSQYRDRSFTAAATAIARRASAALSGRPISSGAPQPTASPNVATSVREARATEDPTLPDEWLRCTNVAAHFSVGAPADWYTAAVGLYEASPGFDGACSFFDPQPFTVTPDVTNQLVQFRFPVGSALPAQRYDDAVAGYTSCCNITELREVTIAGRNATQLVLTTRTSVNPGQRYGCVIVDHDGTAFTACTFDDPTDTGRTFHVRQATLAMFLMTLQFSQ